MNKELLLVVEGLSREKNVEKQIVFSALESAISSATKKKLNDHEIDIEVKKNYLETTYFSDEEEKPNSFNEDYWRN